MLFKIKDLDWKQVNPREIKAPSHFGDYGIVSGIYGQVWALLILHEQIQWVKRVGDIDEAKKVCNEDYETKMKTCLIPLHRKYNANNANI